MKYFLLTLILLPFVSISQSKTSTADGNYNDPNNWWPIGVPTNGYDIAINHDLIMDGDIYYTDGQIVLGSGGSLTDDGNNRTFWCGSGGTIYMNGGTINCHLLRLSPNISAYLYGSYFNVDTLWNEEDWIGGTIHINANYFLNDTAAHFYNYGTMNIADSLVNRGTFVNNNLLNVTDVYNYGDFTNSFSLLVSNNLDNCNTQATSTTFSNSLLVCVEGDLTNCVGNTLSGSGNFFTGGTFTNYGAVTGNLSLLSPSGILSLPGYIDTSVVVGIGECAASLDEQSLSKLKVHPNPTSSEITVSVTGVDFKVYNPIGQLVLFGRIENNQISLEGLESGVYTLVVDDYQVHRVVKE